MCGSPLTKENELAASLRERTIAFYEIVRSENGSTQKCKEQLDFPAMLKRLGKENLANRTVRADRDLIGGTVQSDGSDHLVLHKVKSDSDWLSRADFNTGEIKELENKAGEGYLDSSVICFASFGNVLAIMEGSTSAPTHKALESWLNKMGPFGGNLLIRPVMSPGEYEKFVKGDAVQRIEIKTSTGLNTTGKNGVLASTFRKLRHAYGDASVTLTISAPRRAPKKGQTDPRERLYADLMELEEDLTKADRARIGLLYAEGDKFGRARVTELVEHHVTAKRRVAAVDAEGNSIKILGAIQVMLYELDQFEAELKAAVGANVSG